MLKAFPMVKGWLPLVALYKIIKLGGFENLRNSSKVSEKWGYEYRSPSLTHKFVFVFADVRLNLTVVKITITNAKKLAF